MNDGGGRIISREGESCPGCQSPYTCEIENPPSLVKRTARIIPGCSHNLCENCIAADGDNTGQVSCRQPGCSTKVAWTGGFEEFHINWFFHITLQSGQDCENEAIVASPESQEDNCEIMCSECVEERAECLCQQCKTNLCYNCFEKIHKDIKIFESHKPRSIDNVIVEEKKEQYMKISNCEEHNKMKMYIAEDGREGCAKCVIFGELKGIEVKALEEVEEKTKNDLKEKIAEGKEKLANLKSVLSDFESDKNKESINSTENLANKIKAHFNDCHIQLQTLENSLYQKLEKDQENLNAWQADLESSVKSTESKITKLVDIVKISEGALEKVSNPGIYDFNEMMNVLSKLVDGPDEIFQKSRPSTGNIQIDQGFVNRLKSHVTFSHNSEVERDASLVVPVDENAVSDPESLASQKMTENPSSQSFTENLVGESAHENEAGQNITENLVSKSDTENSVCENAGEMQSIDMAAPERNKGKYRTTKMFTFSKEVNDNEKKIDLAVQGSKTIRKSPRVKRLPSDAKPFPTTRKSSRRSRCAPSVAEECQDGNNNENQCSGVHEADAQEIAHIGNLPRKRVSSPVHYESSAKEKEQINEIERQEEENKHGPGNIEAAKIKEILESSGLVPHEVPSNGDCLFTGPDDHDKPPASKKTRKLAPLTGKCSKNVSDLLSPNANTIKIKPATPKKVGITSAIKKSSGVILPNQNTCKVQDLTKADKAEASTTDIGDDSDTESVMFIKTVDTDYSCKVSNCLANFWFKSELEEHKKTVHQSKSANVNNTM